MPGVRRPWITNLYASVIAVERSAQVFAQPRLRRPEESRCGVDVDDKRVRGIVDDEIQAAEIDLHARGEF